MSMDHITLLISNTTYKKERNCFLCLFSMTMECRRVSAQGDGY